MRMSRSFFALAALGSAASLAACSYVPRIPGVTPYRMEIQQGNFISQEMLSQLKSGMSKEQVRLALGTPLLADAFHADRWDYVYWREASDGKRESRKLVVLFADGKLTRANGDNGEVIPLESPPGQPVPPPTTQAPVAPGTQTPPAGETR
jgi:outer membrane protein assembly factor BamE